MASAHATKERLTRQITLYDIICYGTPQPETRKLQQVCYHQVDNRMCSNRSGLMVTSLLQVVNKLAASCELHAGLMQVVSSTSPQVCKIEVASSLMFTELLQLDDVNRLDTTCWQIASGR